jgi:TonB family protein
MKRPKKEKHFIQKPTYPGGSKALWTFIRKNLRYPKEAWENKISGVVRLKYTIDGKGRVTHTQVIHSLGYGCDEEASRVVKLLKYEVAKVRKGKVKFHRSINVKFKPPQKKSIKVTYSESKKPDEKEKSKSYGYTIRLG